MNGEQNILTIMMKNTLDALFLPSLEVRNTFLDSSTHLIKGITTTSLQKHKIAQHRSTVINVYLFVLWANFKLDFFYTSSPLASYLTIISSGDAPRINMYIWYQSCGLPKIISRKWLPIGCWFLWILFGEWL